MSILQIILLAGSLHGLILVFLLFSRKSNKIANRFLAAFVFIVSLHMVLVAGDSREFFMQFPHLSRIGWLLPTLFGAFIYLYTRSLVNSYSRINLKDFWVFLPFLIYLVILSPYFLQTAELKRHYISNYANVLKDDFGWINQLTNMLHVIFLSVSLLEIHRYQKKIVQFYSEVEKIRLRWLQQLIVILLSLILFSISIFYLRKWEVEVVSHIYPYHYIGVVIIFYWIAYKALTQPQLFHFEIKTGETNIPAKKYKNSSLNNKLSDQHLQKLLKYMEVSKPYLNSELTLTDLAQQVGISKHHISQVINDKLSQNFFDFVNSYRVKEIQRLLLDPEKKYLSTLGIALDAGFNSKSTFNAAFKRITGKTPREYVQTSREEV